MSVNLSIQTGSGNDRKKQEGKRTRLYNVFFPIWMITYLFPSPLLGIVLAINLVVDSLVFRLSTIRIRKTTQILHPIWTVAKLWICGFLADFLAALVAAALEILFPQQEEMLWGLIWNPFSNPLSFLAAAFLTLLGGVMIYGLDFFLALRKSGLSKDQRRHVALMMTIFTAPYLFLVPSAWMYSSWM